MSMSRSPINWQKELPASMERAAADLGQDAKAARIHAHQVFNALRKHHGINLRMPRHFMEGPQHTSSSARAPNTHQHRRQRRALRAAAVAGGGDSGDDDGGDGPGDGYVTFGFLSTSEQGYKDAVALVLRARAMKSLPPKPWFPRTLAEAAQVTALPVSTTEGGGK